MDGIVLPDHSQTAFYVDWQRHHVPNAFVSQDTR